MNGFPIFDTYEDEMAYYANQEQKALESKPSRPCRTPLPYQAINGDHRAQH